MENSLLNGDAGANESITPSGYLTKPEVATRLRKTTRTIDAWMAAGILPYMKIGRSVLFDWDDCQRHLTEYFRVSRFSPRADKKGFSDE